MVPWDYDLDFGILCKVQDLKDLAVYCQKEMKKYNKNYECRFISVENEDYATKIEFFDPSQGLHLDNEEIYGPYWYNVIVDM